jgi:hypothetical protein
MGIARSASRVARVAIAALVVATGVSIAQPASAASTPPNAHSGLIGTWTNETSTAGTLLEKLVISPNGSGGITVDTFGRCGAPTLCEYGKVPAVVFGAAADSTTGAFFQTNQAFASYNKVLSGRLINTTAGRRITLDRYVAWKVSSRHNSGSTYQFKRESTSTAGTTKSGTATTAYPAGNQPSPTASLLGTWNNTNASTRGLAKVVITLGGGGSLLVHAFGACTPTLCDNGTFTAITYGPNSSAPSGGRFLAPNDPGFKRETFAGRLVAGSGTLKLTYFSEFTDASGRSNYAISETFAH